jgi:hypothetical protein
LSEPLSSSKPFHLKIFFCKPSWDFQLVMSPVHLHRDWVHLRRYRVRDTDSPKSLRFPHAVASNRFDFAAQSSNLFDFAAQSPLIFRFRSSILQPLRLP